MKILFTLLSLDCGNLMYLQSAKRLVNEVLEQTNHDVLLSTNNLGFFNDVISERFFLRNNIDESSILMYNSEFNYNLKYHAFKDIPINYDVIIYLDCDIKLDSWSINSDNLINKCMSTYDFGATRLNCLMGDSVQEYRETGRTLFSHKLHSYKIMENYCDSDDIMNSLLPSEHFLILKNDTEKVVKFYKKWEELNNYLQSIDGSGGSWGDGFEIGVSARYSGFHKTIEINQGMWDSVLGFKFNGNKYIDESSNLSINKNEKILDIIAVTYNQDMSLKCFINSIKCQTNTNWRLFIIHDGLNPQLKDDLIENNYLTNNVIFIEHPEKTENYGHFLRKWGVNNLIENEYTLITNCDNYYTPNMVDEVLKYNEDLIYFDCVHSHITNFNHNNSSYGYMNCKLLANEIDMGCVVVKTIISKSVGFNSNGFTADWDYFNDILSLNPSIAKIDKILFVHN